MITKIGIAVATVSMARSCGSGASTIRRIWKPAANANASEAGEERHDAPGRRAAADRDLEVDDQQQRRGGDDP